METSLPISKKELWVIIYGPRVVLAGFICALVLGIASLAEVHFQRLGSLFVFLAVITFAVTRSISNRLETWSLLRFEEILVSKAVFTATERTLDAMKAASVIRQGSEALSELRQNVFEPSDKSTEKLKSHLEGIKNRSAVYEAIVVALATLQWGYGDLFHCWVNGNGWRVCY